MLCIITDGLAWSVGHRLSVYMSVTVVSPTKTAELIDMPFLFITPFTNHFLAL